MKSHLSIWHTLLNDKGATMNLISSMNSKFSGYEFEELKIV